MKELIKIGYDKNNQPTVLGRDLHEFLEVKEPYTMWFDRMKDYGFAEDVDFKGLSVFTEKPQGGRPKINHQITVSMAKEISMIQRTPKGRQARLYFIECEKIAQEKLYKPKLLSRKELALMILDAEKEIDSLKIEVNYKDNVIEGLTQKIPTKNLRSKLNIVIRKNAGRKDLTFSSMWNDLYNEFMYVYNINLPIRAKNKNYNSTLDYVEDNGYMDKLYGLAVKKYESK